LIHHTFESALSKIVTPPKQDTVDIDPPAVDRQQIDPTPFQLGQHRHDVDHIMREAVDALDDQGAELAACRAFKHPYEAITASKTTTAPPPINLRLMKRKTLVLGSLTTGFHLPRHIGGANLGGIDIDTCPPFGAVIVNIVRHRRTSLKVVVASTVEVM